MIVSNSRADLNSLPKQGVINTLLVKSVTESLQIIMLMVRDGMYEGQRTVSDILMLVYLHGT